MAIHAWWRLWRATLVAVLLTFGGLIHPTVVPPTFNAEIVSCNVSERWGNHLDAGYAFGAEKAKNKSGLVFVLGARKSVGIADASYYERLNPVAVGVKCRLLGRSTFDIIFAKREDHPVGVCLRRKQCMAFKWGILLDPAGDHKLLIDQIAFINLHSHLRMPTDVKSWGFARVFNGHFAFDPTFLVIERKRTGHRDRHGDPGALVGDVRLLSNLVGLNSGSGRLSGKHQSKGNGEGAKHSQIDLPASQAKQFFRGFRHALLRYQVGILTSIGVALCLPVTWGIALILDNRRWLTWLEGWALIVVFGPIALAVQSWAAYGDPFRVGPIGAIWRAWHDKW